MKNEDIENKTVSDDQLVIIREFNAPQRLVFEALTEGEHIMQWACPQGMSITYFEGDFEVGGNYEYVMKSANGPEMKLIGEYQVINPYSELTYTQSHIMPNEQKTPETLIEITLEETGNKTQMVFKQSGFTQIQDAENATKGWESAFEKLTNLLNNLT